MDAKENIVDAIIVLGLGYIIEQSGNVKGYTTDFFTSLKHQRSVSMILDSFKHSVIILFILFRFNLIYIFNLLMFFYNKKTKKNILFITFLFIIRWKTLT